VFLPREGDPAAARGLVPSPLIECYIAFWEKNEDVNECDSLTFIFMFILIVIPSLL
jgi:hypothetical protein